MGSSFDMIYIERPLKKRYPDSSVAEGLGTSPSFPTTPIVGDTGGWVGVFQHSLNNKQRL